MDMNLKIIKRLFKQSGLSSGKRNFFSDSDIRTIITTIGDGNDVVELDVSSILQIHFATPKQALYNKHHKLCYNDPFITADINRDDKSITNVKLTEKFFETYYDRLKSEKTSDMLTPDELMAKEQNITLFTPTTDYKSCFVSIEQNSFRDAFEESSIELKNASRFEKVSKESDMRINANTPKHLNVTIIRPLTETKLHYNSFFSLRGHQVGFDVYDYEKCKTELELHNGGILPTLYDDPKKTPKISKEALMKYSDAQIPFYAYDCTVHLDDKEYGPICITSFTPLLQTNYDIYGYCKIGTKTKSMHIKSLVAIETDNNNITPDQVLVDNKAKPEKEQKTEHNFFKLYRFLRGHSNKQGRPLLKFYGDAIIWMEVIKTLHNLGPYDIEKRTHGIYAGLQDSGKTYIAQTFDCIRYPYKPLLTPDNTSMPGLRGGASQTLVLPDDEIKGHQNLGEMASTNIIIDEVGEAITRQSQNSDFREMIATFKAFLFSPSITIAKAQGGITPRNAVLTMTMNYSSGYKELLRRELLTHIQAEEQKWIKENKESQVLGEGGSISMDGSPMTKQPQLLEMGKLKDFFVDLESLPEDEYYDTEIKQDVSLRNAIIFKRGVASFKFQKLKDEVDISTSLPDSVMKRLPFSVFGSISEKYKAQNKKLHDNIASKDALKKLFVPNLKDIISGIITTGEKKYDYEENKEELLHILSFFWEKITEKHDIEKRFGENTAKEFFVSISKTLMFFNQEKVPSYQTIRLIEQWVILQCYNVRMIEARSYIKLEQMVDRLGYFNQKTYKEVLKNAKDS